MSGMFNRVHIVFENEHLMMRDRADFESYWILLGYEDNTVVQYHVGCKDFKPVANELVIVDEADSLIFRDPVHFREFIRESPSVCFTATPDN
jgi:hypothetical protein